MSLIGRTEAIAVAIEPANNGYKELELEDIRDNPMKLVMGYFKGMANEKYTVDLLNNWYSIHGQVVVKESALGIPVEAKVQNSFGTEVKTYGVVNLNTNFSDNEIEVYTDLGAIKVMSSDITRITSWYGAEQKNESRK